MKFIYKILLVLIVIAIGAFDYNLVSFKGKLKIATKFVDYSKYEGEMVDVNTYTYAPYPFVDKYWTVIESKKEIVVITYSDEMNKAITNDIKEGKKNNIFVESYHKNQPLSLIFYGAIIIFILVTPRPKKE